MSQPAAVGLDLGTSGLKAVLVTDDGTVHARTRRSYPVLTPRPGWAETDPAVWEIAAREAVAELLAASPATHEVVGLGIDGQMHGLVLADETGKPTRPAILWPDSRASGDLDTWLRLGQRQRAALANPITAGMTGPMLAWLRQHDPAALDRAAYFQLPKDWLRSRFSGELSLSDPSDCSATLLWDVVADTWHEGLIRQLGIDRAKLPTVANSGTPVGRMSAETATGWGLPVGTAVATGCADVAATLLGSGTRPGHLLLTIGTGLQAVVSGIDRTPTSTPRYHTYRGVDGWYAMGAIINGGLALRRVTELLAASWEDLYREYDRDRAIPGFVPFLAGERLPTRIRSGSGEWFGISLDTERRDLLAASIEGVAFAVRRIVEDLPPAAEQVELAGGGAQNNTFVQLLADVLQRPLVRLSRPEITAVGAAILGMRAAGLELEVAEDRHADVIQPQPNGALSQRYSRFLDHLAERTASG